MQAGRRVVRPAAIAESRAHAAAAIGELPDGLRRLTDWEAYEVRVSDALQELTTRTGRSV
jgi:hypothetical protein